MQRREVVQTLLAALATNAFARGSQAASAALCTQLAEGIDLDACRALGREYLAQHPADPGVQAVLSQQLSQLHDSMREDYAAGRLVNLSGWFVSRTEARIFASLGTC